MKLAAATIALVVALGPSPKATLRSEQKINGGYNQGIARIDSGWIVSGTFVLVRMNDELRVTKSLSQPIPVALRVKGYNHVGDIDVVDKYIYAPLEQPDFEKGEQITACYDAKTLKFVDSVTLAQHENSFVTVDPKTMTAYSMDHFGGDALLRYDVRNGWAPLPPLAMSQFVDKVQGADVARGAVWLSTCSRPGSSTTSSECDPAPTNELFRVDLATGAVVDLGSAGHVGGEGEGIDATRLRSGALHTLTVDAKLTRVWLGHFGISTGRRR
ncbi:MAG TPA: hypothetical protein VIH82_10725 [Acidimicrobiia bacterium]